MEIHVVNLIFIEDCWQLSMHLAPKRPFVWGSSCLACHVPCCSQVTSVLDQVSTGGSNGRVPICGCQILNSILNGNINQTHTQPVVRVPRIQDLSLSPWLKEKCGHHRSWRIQQPCGMSSSCLSHSGTWCHPAGRVALTLASVLRFCNPPENPERETQQKNHKKFSAALMCDTMQPKYGPIFWLQEVVLKGLVFFLTFQQNIANHGLCNQFHQ